MSFLDTIAQAMAFLQRHQRVSLRTPRREFSLDTGTLADLSAELINVQRIAVPGGEVLGYSAGRSLAVVRQESPGQEPRVKAPALKGTQGPVRSPPACTPKQLADRILQWRSALEGDHKQVTLLFADVKGSMELAQQLDPEEWHTLLERFFAILTGGVHRFEGTVNQ